jgi:hypothetical protein
MMLCIQNSRRNSTVIHAHFIITSASRASTLPWASAAMALAHRDTNKHVRFDPLFLKKEEERKEEKEVRCFCMRRCLRYCTFRMMKRRRQQSCADVELFLPLFLLPSVILSVPQKLLKMEAATEKASKCFDKRSFAIFFLYYFL